MREEDESNIRGGETDMDLYTPVDSLVICPSCEGFGEGCQLCNGSGKVKKLISDTMARVTPLPRKTVMVSTP